VSGRAAAPVIGRRRWCLGTAGLLALAGCGTVARRQGATVAPGAGIMPFSATRRLGGLPEGWHEQVMRRDKPLTIYRTAQRDGRIALHALADGATSGLRCDVDVDPVATPWLGWEWRVEQMALAATVAADELDDAPVRVVVAFDGDPSLLSWRELVFQEQAEAFTGYTLPFATLMYVWDGQAALDSVFAYPRSARIRYLVVETGESNTGRWCAHRRNVVDDYRRVFGGEPGRIHSVGVLTDSDDLRTRSEAWYGDLGFTA
jgi:Protein of unknown function (DUF3047)